MHPRIRTGLLMTGVVTHALSAAVSAQTAVDVSAQRVDRTPEWSLGSRMVLLTDDGGDNGFSRLGNACFGRDGRLAVLSFQPPRVLVFDARGQRAGTLGRKGQGPGEFEQPQRVSCFGADSLAVAEFARLSLFAFTGSGGVSVSLADGERVRSPLSRLAGGRVLARVLVPLARPDGVSRDSAELVLLAPTGIRGLGRYAQGEVFQFRVASAVTTAMSPFGPTLLADASDDALYLMDTRRPELRIVPVGGRPERIVRFALAPREVPGAAVVAERARIERGSARAGPALVAAQLAALPLPKTLPVFDRVLPVRGGGAALRRTVTTVDSLAQWLWLSAEGEPRARWTVPTRLRVLAATSTVVVGVEADADGIESVVQYTWRR